MTLNDLEWLNGHFTLNFHYYELTLRVIIYLFTIESVYIHTRSQRRCGEAEWWTVIRRIYGIRGKTSDLS